MNSRILCLLLASLAFGQSTYAIDFFLNTVIDVTDDAGKIYMNNEGTLIGSSHKGLINYDEYELGWYGNLDDSAGNYHRPLYTDQTEFGLRRAIYHVSTGSEGGTKLIKWDPNGQLHSEFSTLNFDLHARWGIQKIDEDTFVGLHSWTSNLIIFDSELNVLSITELPKIHAAYSRNGILLDSAGNIQIFGTDVDASADPEFTGDVYRYVVNTDGEILSESLVGNHPHVVSPVLFDDQSFWLIGGDFEDETPVIKVHSYDANSNFLDSSSVLPPFSVANPGGAEVLPQNVSVDKILLSSDGSINLLITANGEVYPPSPSLPPAVEQQMFVQLDQDVEITFVDNMTANHLVQVNDMIEDIYGTIVMFGNTGSPFYDLNPKITILQYGDMDSTPNPNTLYACEGQTVGIPYPVLPTALATCYNSPQEVVVNPGGLVFAEGEEFVLVAPTTTTTYTVTMNIDSSLDPDCDEGVFEYTVEVEVNDCTPNQITTCPGVAVPLPAPPVAEAPGPGNQCLFQNPEITVEPNVAVISANDEDGYWFAPLETTTYTITRTYPGTPTCPPVTSSLTNTIYVEFGPDCPDPNGQQIVVPGYPWISDVLSGAGCESYSEVWKYTSAGYDYIYLKAVAGTGVSSKLYNESGQLYCTETGSYDCIAAYGFASGTKLFSCTDPQECNCEAGGTVVCGADGQEYENACFADCFGVAYVSGPCGVVEPPSDGLEDYPWVGDIFNLSNCFSINEVTLYTSGSYEYLYFEVPNGNNVLYNASGQLYCTESGTYDCVAAYGFTQGESIWTCVQPPICDCGSVYVPVCANGIEYFNSCEAECDGYFDWTPGTCPDGPGPTEEYPWLTDILSGSSCCEVQNIVLYESNGFEYIYVIPQLACGEGTLYNAQGQYYCETVGTYNCLDLYGFTQGVELYSCDGSGPDPVDCDNGTFGTATIGGCGIAATLAIQLPTGEYLYPTDGFPDGFTLDEPTDVFFTFEYTGDDFCDGVLIDLICMIPANIDPPDEWFGAYTWLPSVLGGEPDCCTVSSVWEYTNGSTSYIVLNPDGECGGDPVLYNSSGQLYCSSQPGYDCISLYGLNSWTTNVLWSCSGKEGLIAIDEDSYLYDLAVYPNPSNGQVNVTVQGELDEAQLQVIDLSGKLVYQDQVQATNYLSLEHLNPGMYLLQVIHQKQVLVEKILIE